MSEELRVRLRAAMERAGLNMKQLSLASGKGETLVRDILERGRTPRYATLQALATALKTPLADLLPPEQSTGGDALQLSQVMSLRAEPGRLPVYSAVEAGNGGMTITYDTVEWIDLPPALQGVAGAFGLYVVGDSMAPMLKRGDMVHVHPTRPPRLGDLVICIVKSPQPDGDFVGYVKLLRAVTAEHVVLEQLSPAKELRLRKRDVRVHRVVGVEYA